MSTNQFKEAFCKKAGQKNVCPGCQKIGKIKILGVKILKLIFIPTFLYISFRALDSSRKKTILRRRGDFWGMKKLTVSRGGRFDS